MQKMPNELLQCYNRGCGQKYEPETNSDESCLHHPGDPFFHDAYKGWSCCNKKCTDFTEFLNIKGCTQAKHSNVKPPEPEKPQKMFNDLEVINVNPIVKQCLERPPFEMEMIVITPEIAPSAKKQREVMVVDKKDVDSTEIAVGTSCKNGGCRTTYDGPQTNETLCTYHPGCPIFHEGMKYWSCCQKKTTDFNVFLNQTGCLTGKHIWMKEGDDSKNIQCRYDFHQTATHVIVSIYAKEYCLNTSEIKLNPVRLYANLIFPQQCDAVFNLDVELFGIIDIPQSKVCMFGTKVEIIMRKGEPCTWSRLEVPRKSASVKSGTKVDKLTSQIDCVDLEDLIWGFLCLTCVTRLA